MAVNGVNGVNGIHHVSRPLKPGIFAPIPTFFLPDSEDLGEFLIATVFFGLTSIQIYIHLRPKHFVWQLQVLRH